MKPPVLLAAALAAGVLAVSACGSSASSSATISAAAASAPPLSPPPTAVTLAPLTLASFPATTDGELAKGICQQWQGLRQQYEDRTVTDSPYALNQWFSSAAWQPEDSDASALNGDPAYSKIETAFGVGTVGDDASAGAVREMDAACAAGD